MTEPTPEEPTTDPEDPGEPAPVVLEPATYYDATALDENPACVNYGRTFQINPMYSNAGTVVPQCGICRHGMRLVSATRLDPQPEVV